MKFRFLLPALTFALTVLTISSAIANENPLLIKPGIWRGVFTTPVSEIPFNFEIKGTDQSKLTLTLLNASRRDDFVVTRKGQDSLLINMNTFDAVLLVKMETAGNLTGAYKNLVPGNQSKPIPFVAEYGKSYRFVEPSKQTAARTNLSGKWLIKIMGKTPVPDKVALFTQQGNALSGVIMQVTGDSGDLEGIVQGNTFSLSSFIGSGPKMYKGVINTDSTISGIWSVSNGDTIRYTGVKNPDAELPDAYRLTFLKPGYEKLSFTFPDVNGRPVSLSDKRFKGKVVIIDIMGSWCPNCMDETMFLAPWYKTNAQKGVEIVGVAFEMKDSLEYAKYTLNKLKARYDIQYPLVFGGYADNNVVAARFPALNEFIAFPTTIIVDRQGRVREIYTGFSGKATGKYYDEFQEKFNRLIDKLIAEPVTP